MPTARSWLPGTLIVTNRNAIPYGTSLTVGGEATSIFGTSGSLPAASTISTVPEPSSWTLCVYPILAGMLLWRQRRRVTSRDQV